MLTNGFIALTLFAQGLLQQIENLPPVPKPKPKPAAVQPAPIALPRPKPKPKPVQIQEISGEIKPGFQKEIETGTMPVAQRPTKGTVTKPQPGAAIPEGGPIEFMKPLPALQIPQKLEYDFSNLLPAKFASFITQKVDDLAEASDQLAASTEAAGLLPYVQEYYNKMRDDNSKRLVGKAITALQELAPQKETLQDID